MPWFWACGVGDEGHPLAVASAAPAYVAEDDAYQTVVTLSAKGSLGEAHLPGVEVAAPRCLTELAWSVVGTPYGIVSGAESCRPDCACATADEAGCVAALECELGLTFPGTHVARITLAVTNEEGDRDTAVVTLGLSAP